MNYPITFSIKKVRRSALVVLNFKAICLLVLRIVLYE